MTKAKADYTTVAFSDPGGKLKERIDSEREELGMSLSVWLGRALTAALDEGRVRETQRR